MQTYKHTLSNIRNTQIEIISLLSHSIPLPHPRPRSFHSLMFHIWLSHDSAMKSMFYYYNIFFIVWAVQIHNFSNIRHSSQILSHFFFWLTGNWNGKFWLVPIRRIIIAWLFGAILRFFFMRLCLQSNCSV